MIIILIALLAILGMVAIRNQILINDSEAEIRELKERLDRLEALSERHHGGTRKNVS